MDRFLLFWSSRLQGLMTTVHAMTATQLTVDGPSRGGKAGRPGPEVPATSPTRYKSLAFSDRSAICNHIRMEQDLRVADRALMSLQCCRCKPRLHSLNGIDPHQALEHFFN